jgi:phosphate transport system substrate-binding protein
MKIKYLAVTLGLLAATLSNVNADRLVIKGSDTLGAKLVPQLAEQFKAQHPGTTFEIVAYDGLGVIVNSANPIKGLTKKQVEQIFTGDITDWGAVGGKPGKISIYTRNTSSGTYSDWKELAMKKRDYASGSQKMAGHEQIAAEVGKNPNGVGYVGLAYMKAGGIKVVPIDGLMPSQASVINKTWPYARPTFYYTNGDPSGLAKQFVDFTTSSDGQKIVNRVGFVPIREMK